MMAEPAHPALTGTDSASAPAAAWPAVARWDRSFASMAYFVVPEPRCQRLAKARERKETQETTIAFSSKSSKRCEDVPSLSPDRSNPRAKAPIRSPFSQFEECSQSVVLSAALIVITKHSCSSAMECQPDRYEKRLRLGLIRALSSHPKRANSAR